jgi:hypothetical protein
MTLPDERYRAIKYTEQFLKDLCNRSKTPRLPREIRQRASSLLRHYPSEYHLDQLSENSPDVIIKQMEPLTRMVMSYQQEKTDDNAS